MMQLTYSASSTKRDRRIARGFTLVELLIVLFLLMLLAAIALPTVRNVLLEQKNSRAARSIASFCDIARSRAIAEDREVGVLIERLSSDSTDTIGASAGIRLRQLTGVPSYSGESADSRAVLSNLSGSGAIDSATFEGADNQLLLLSAIQSGSSTAPIRPSVDRMELPGGKVVTITGLQVIDSAGSVVTSPNLSLDLNTYRVRAVFNPRNVITPSSATPTFEFPEGARRQLSVRQQVKYRIHRAPALSSTAPLALPRGIAVDLNYSGIGLTGNQFALSAGTSSIQIIFGPDGRVARVVNAAGDLLAPTSQIFLCLGDFSGIRPDDLFAASGRDRANIARNKSSWIVINNQTGRVTVSPFASVSAATLASANMSESLREARLLASLSDSVEGK